MTRHDLSLEQRADAYERMARALEFLGDTWREHPDLSECARSMDLSPSQFQREFTRWAGLSPKQFQGAIAHAEAGKALREGASVLDAALDAGLSGPGRLHDLFIAHEGLTPGEAKSGADGVRLTIGRAPSPFGTAVLVIAPKGLAGLGFADDGVRAKDGFEHPGYPEAQVFAELMSRYPNADFVRDDAVAREWAGRVFEPDQPLPLVLYGTPFRRQVWRALVSIPAGETRTYGWIAERVCTKKAARAVGAAVGANPIAWCIPCHRALASDGRLHNYHWGVARKRAMLAVDRASVAMVG